MGLNDYTTGQGKIYSIKPYGLSPSSQASYSLQTSNFKWQIAQKISPVSSDSTVKDLYPCALRYSFSGLTLLEKNKISQEYKEKEGTFNNQCDYNRETNEHSNNNNRE